MYNLIQTMDAIRGLPTQDVMKYANGSNPDVPAYLALAELNRRKQIEDTSSAFYGQQPTVKEQIESSLTGAPRGQMNPTAPSQGQTNPTQLPPQLAPSPTAPSRALGAPQANIAGAPVGQVNPASAPPMPPQGLPPTGMARGGLASLPLPHMFRQNSYAGGGIVAFAEPTDTTVGVQAIDQLGSQLDSVKSRLNSLTPPGISSRVNPAAMEDYNAQKAQLQSQYNALNSQYQDAIKSVGLDKPAMGQLNKNMRLVPVANPAMQQLTGIKPPPFADSDAAEQADRMTGNKVEPTAVPKDPNKQASATTSGQVSTARPPAFSQQAPTSQDLTDEQLFARRKKLEELAGVSADPMADIKRRYAAIEAKRAAQEAEDPYNRTIERLAEFATAAPEKGFGYQAAMSAKAGAKLEREQEALRDKQATEMASLQGNIAKEDDARKRGDVKGVEEARAAQQKNKMDLAELEVKRMNAQANMVQANRPTQYSEMIALAKNNPELFAKMQGQSKSGMMTLEEAYKAVIQDPMNATLTEEQKRQKAKELYNWASAGGNSAPKVMSMADVRETAKKSGRTEQQVIDAAKSKGYTIQ
jgi:hypothetical protein